MRRAVKSEYGKGKSYEPQTHLSVQCLQSMQSDTTGLLTTPFISEAAVALSDSRDHWVNKRVCDRVLEDVNRQVFKDVLFL